MILRRPTATTMDIFNNSTTTCSSSPSAVSQNDVQDETAVLYQILQEVQMLKEIISTLVKRRTTCSRSTQTESQQQPPPPPRSVDSRISIADASSSSSKPLNLSAGKRSSRTLSDSTTMRQSKSTRMNNSAGGATSSIEEAVAKIKAIRSEKSNNQTALPNTTMNNNGKNRNPAADICATSSETNEHNNDNNINNQVAYLQGHQQFRCSSQQSNATVADMIASAAAAAATVTGCYPPMMNGDGSVMAVAAAAAAGILPTFSPLIDSLVLSSPHCNFGGDASQNVTMDFVQQNSSRHYAFSNKTCQRGGAALDRPPPPPPVECGKAPPATTMDTVSSTPQAPKIKHGDCKGQKSFGADYYKPYACQHANCNKRFANKFLLKKHEFIHTGERPHQCPYCCKRFNRKDNLLRHKKTHESNNVLVKRTVRPLGFCQTAEAVNAKRATAPTNTTTGCFRGESVLQYTIEPITQTSSLVSPEGGGGDKDTIMIGERAAEEEEGGGSEESKLNQESTSDGGGECAVVVELTTPSDDNLLPCPPVTSKTTSTSQLPMATSFGVTN